MEVKNHGKLTGIPTWLSGARASYYVGKLFESFVTGSVVSGTRGRVSLPSEFFTVRLLSNSSLSDLFNSIIVFDLNGLRFHSIDISPEDYTEAYDLGMTHNIIYSSGNVTIVRRGTLSLAP